MSAKPSWQDTPPHPATKLPYAGPVRSIPPHVARLFNVLNAVTTLALAAFLFWSMQTDAQTRWLIVGLVLASGVLNFFFLRRLGRQQGG